MSLTKEEIKKKIKEAAERYIRAPKYKVFFFGSRINGKATNRSDYDIGILAEKQLPPAIVGNIKEELENLRVLQKFDVVDFKNVDDGFKEVAMQTIEVIYEK